MAEAVAQNPQKDVSAPTTTARSSFSAPSGSHEETEPASRDEESKPADSEKLAQVQSIDDAEYPHGPKLFLILISLYLAVFLMALDRTIIATAIPQLTDDFHSFGDVGWYASAFLLTSGACQLVLGRLYTFYSPKWVFLSCIAVFELGSLICAVAPNSPTFIVGRAIAGIGSAGIITGAIVLLMYAVPLHKRPMYTGFVGAIFGVASVAGPLLGGVFTTEVTWRWCFYINLPIGAATIVFLVFFLQAPAPKQGGLSLKKQFAQLDPLGTICFIPSMVCLLLALQWGGSTYAWKSWRIILLFVVFGVLLIAFVGIQLWLKDAGTVPPRIFKQRSIAAGFWFMCTTGAAFMVMVYYLPIWFQAIKGYTAIHSGIATLPMLLGLVITSILNGILVSKLGYYTPSLIASSIICSIGAGIFTIFKVHTAHPLWIGIQVLFGIGIGLGMQQANTAAQTVLHKADSPTGVALMMLGMTIGGAVASSIGQNVLNNRLIAGLAGLPSFDPRTVINTGATELRNAFPTELLPQVLRTYDGALTDVFTVALVASCLSILGSVFMEFKSVKSKRPQQH